MIYLFQKMKQQINLEINQKILGFLNFVVLNGLNWKMKYCYNFDCHQLLNSAPESGRTSFLDTARLNTIVNAGWRGTPGRRFDRGKSLNTSATANTIRGHRKWRRWHPVWNLQCCVWEWPRAGAFHPGVHPPRTPVITRHHMVESSMGLPGPLLPATAPKPAEVDHWTCPFDWDLACATAPLLACECHLKTAGIAVS